MQHPLLEQPCSHRCVSQCVTVFERVSVGSYQVCHRVTTLPVLERSWPPSLAHVPFLVLCSRLDDRCATAGPGFASKGRLATALPLQLATLPSLPPLPQASPPPLPFVSCCIAMVTIFLRLFLRSPSPLRAPAPASGQRNSSKKPKATWTHPPFPPSRWRLAMMISWRWTS